MIKIEPRSTTLILNFKVKIEELYTLFQKLQTAELTTYFVILTTDDRSSKFCQIVGVFHLQFQDQTYNFNDTLLLQTAKRYFGKRLQID